MPLPENWVDNAGNVVNAAYLNALDVAVNALVAGGYIDPLTTAGDIVVRGATTTTRKAVGSAGQVLRVNTGNADKLEYATLTKADVVLGNVDNTSDATVLAAAKASSLAFALFLG